MSERDFQALESELKILEALDSLSLIPSVAYSGVTNKIATCALKNHSGSIVSEGAGKGKHCYIGAMAESIEHYALENSAIDGFIHCSANDIRNQVPTQMDGILANIPPNNNCIECVEVSDIRSGVAILVPSILHLPHRHNSVDCSAPPGLSFLNRYSTNSGVAFGCSKDEAIPHGLNEVLERHMYSKILMSLCGQYDSLILKSPSGTVTDDIFEYCIKLRVVARDTKILISKTVHDVYFSMAIPKRPDGRFVICPVGSGASLDPRTAIERAVTELLQSMVLYDDVEKKHDRCARSLIESCRTLQPLIHLEALRNLEYTCQRLDSPPALSVAEQIDFITEKLAGTGLRAYTRIITAFKNECVVAQTYVPGLERFNLVRAGLPVIPQQLLHANKTLS